MLSHKETEEEAYASAKMDESEEETRKAESIRQIQQNAYCAGWHAAMSEIIRVIMQMQAQTPRTPFD